jgi:hypothetical protein
MGIWRATHRVDTQSEEKVFSLAQGIQRTLAQKISSLELIYFIFS